jgi:hypothetical protein
MKKKIILLAVCGITSTAGAQTMYDALTFSENTYYGTARSTAMGNAFTALGGDLGGISINPAGSAVANYSQITITPSLNIAVSTAQGTKWNGEANGFERRMKNSSTRFTLPNIGFTLNYDTHRTSGVTGISVGFMVNGTGYFNDNMIARGTNANTSFMGALAYNTSGWDVGELTMSDAYNSSNAPWESIAGWEAGLISLYGPESNLDQYIGTSEYYTDDGAGNYSVQQAGPLDQNYGRTQSGSKYDYLINLGLNFSDRFYFGVNLGITSLTYAYRDWITEVAQDPGDFELQFQNPDGGPDDITYFSDMNFSYRYNASGVGVYGKFGFIARPFAGLRIGGAIQTPTSTVIKEFWSYSAASYYTDSQYNASSDSPEGQYRYRVISPFRFNVGLAYTFGNFGLISADYEMCDYSGMRLKETETNDNSYYDDGVNADIREYMGASHMFRAGLEIKPAAAFAIRAGYTLTTSPERYYENDVRQPVKANRNSFSAGLGFSSSGSFFADLAFRATKYADEYIYPYSDYILGEDYFPSPEILNRKWMYDVMLTIGFRF